MKFNKEYKIEKDGNNLTIKEFLVQKEPAKYHIEIYDSENIKSHDIEVDGKEMDSYLENDDIIKKAIEDKLNENS